MNEHSRADRALIRAKDVGLVIGILTLAGMLWKLGSKPFQWDQAFAIIPMLQAQMQDHDRRINTIEVRFLDAQEQHNKDQEIIRIQLAAIFRKLDEKR